MRGRSEVGAQGRVVLRLAIDESGTVTDASIVNADAQADLASWALAAGREARFRPGTKGGRIVKSRVLLELTFGPRSDRGAL
jgi:protein TonB